MYQLYRLIYFCWIAHSFKLGWVEPKARSLYNLALLCPHPFWWSYPYTYRTEVSVPMIPSHFLHSLFLLQSLAPTHGERGRSAFAPHSYSINTCAHAFCFWRLRIRVIECDRRFWSESEGGRWFRPCLAFSKLMFFKFSYANVRKSQGHLIHASRIEGSYHIRIKPSALFALSPSPVVSGSHALGATGKVLFGIAQSRPSFKSILSCAPVYRRFSSAFCAFLLNARRSSTVRRVS